MADRGGSKGPRGRGDRGDVGGLHTCPRALFFFFLFFFLYEKSIERGQLGDDRLKWIRFVRFYVIGLFGPSVI